MFETRWIQHNCGNCNAIFAIPAIVDVGYRFNYKSFYCPYCKTGYSYLKETDEERYKRLYEQEKGCCIAAREEANTLERKVWGMKGYATKLKKKLAQR